LHALLVHLSYITSEFAVYLLRKYDPYPCILGIPVMPALFNAAKYYVFGSFLLIGVRCVVAAVRIAYDE